VVRALNPSIKSMSSGPGAVHGSDILDYSCDETERAAAVHRLVFANGD
jgi:hypothetical protein